MIKFNSIEHLASYMFDQVDGDSTISVVVNKNMAVDLLREFLDYENTVLGFCQIDEYEYDKEYAITLFKENNAWHFDIEKIYNDEINRYMLPWDYILFQEDVSNQALVDMQNNEFLPLEKYSIFCVEDDNDFGDTDDDFDGDCDDTDDTDTFNNNIISELERIHELLHSRMNS